MYQPGTAHVDIHSRPQRRDQDKTMPMNQAASDNTQRDCLTLTGPRAIREWAEMNNTSPAVVRAAIRRVGTSASLVREYIDQGASRWSADLFPEDARKHRNNAMEPHISG
jgi:hypothetical protein